MARRSHIGIERERELVRRYLAGEFTKDLAVAFDRSDTGVRDVLRKHGVTPSRRTQLTTKQDAEARGLYESGLSTRQVSKAMSLSENGAKRALKRAGTKMRPRVKRRILSESQEIDLCDRYLAGDDYMGLQALYGVSNTVVQSALRRHDIQPRTGWAKYRAFAWDDRKGRSCVFKSSWELAYAEWLDKQGLDWEYEPCKLGLSECRCYTPDFGVYLDGQFLTFIEVKGWIDERTENRMMEVNRMYPMLPLVFVGPAEMAGMGLVDPKYTTHPQGEIVFRIQQKFNQTA